MRIAIIGAGWYGCHLATTLDALGMHVRLFEQHDRPMHEASGNNQFRLHQGFHYPRHHRTRMQSRDGFLRFTERYPDLSRSVRNNVYAVPEYDSSMDFETYRLIMTATGVDFFEVENIDLPLQNTSGIILTQERVLMLSQARQYFSRVLKGILYTNAKITSIEEMGNFVRVNGEVFDYIIDATWGHFSKPTLKVFYEPTMLLYYEGPKDFPALTFVDGPLCSLYPTEDAVIYTLSSVPHTPIGTFSNPEEARNCLKNVNSDLVSIKIKEMEKQISKYYPDFSGQFKFAGPQLAIKTKPVGSADDRSCYVSRQGRVFHVMSGKIDTIFNATERVLSLLQMSNETQSAPSTLREDIVDINY